jgi:hypothetical protein
MRVSIRLLLASSVAVLFASTSAFAAGKAVVKKNWPTSASPNHPAASSVSTDAAGDHPADLAFDGLIATGWGEGAAGTGEGAWLEVVLGGVTDLKSISIWPGNLSEGAKSYREYARPRTIELLVDGQKVGEQLRRTDELNRWDIPLPAGLKGRKVRIQFVDSFEGVVFSDMFVSEVCVNYVEDLGQPDPRVEKWLASPPGQKAVAEYTAELEKNFKLHKEAEFGNADALKWIMGAAADGPYYLRTEIQKLVPAGERASAIRADPAAISALRRLKDPNGIPAIEAAGLRAVGKEKDKLKELIEIFYAYQELIGGPDPNVPYWGKKGWADGALQSFGEPLPVAVDRQNYVYVVDVGNNRVQRYDLDGKPDRSWGGPTDITNAWFGKGRKWYVSASAPGDLPGTFNNPLAIALLPEKEGDGFAVLDAKGRVQVFDPEGSSKISWMLRTDQEVEPKLGGQAYLAWLPKRSQLWAFYGEDAIGFNLDGEEVGRFNLAEDGAPNALTVSPTGRFWLAFQKNVVQYEQGFRYGTILGEKNLAPGYEDMDLTVDEDGKLWVVIDTGWVFKFKKPGKLDFKVKVVDYPLQHPRIAVRDDIIYLTDQDHVIRSDALKLKLDAEEAAAQAAEDAEQQAAEAGTGGKKKGKGKGKEK